MTSARSDSMLGKLSPSTIASRNVRVFMKLEDPQELDDLTEAVTATIANCNVRILLKLDDSHESVDSTRAPTSADASGSAAPSGASPESPEEPLP